MKKIAVLCYSNHQYRDFTQHLTPEAKKLFVHVSPDKALNIMGVELSGMIILDSFWEHDQAYKIADEVKSKIR